MDATTRLEVRLTVVDGPDAGTQEQFSGSTITIGRSVNNDFTLTDGFVSNYHGEILVTSEGVEFHDRRSRHGSTVTIGGNVYRLHDKRRETSMTLSDDVEIQLGCTLIRVELVHKPLGALPPQARHRVPSASLTSVRETLITGAPGPVRSLTKSFERTDQRLAVIFELAGQLNGLIRLDDILELIVKATFDAFGGANFFALTLLDDDEAFDVSKPPYFVRRRADAPAGRSDDVPILSSSILRQVIETRESVLFVKDSLGTQLTQSIIDAQITACLCTPLIGQRSLLGVMQVDTRGLGTLFSKRDLELFSVLGSLAAFALERAKLSQEIVSMFESFVSASVTAIEARDPKTAGHSERVAHYTMALANLVNTLEDGGLASVQFSADELTELHYAALLHDFGKIAVREDVLQKSARLPQMHLELVAQRFETIKALAYPLHVEAPMREALARGESWTIERLNACVAEHGAFCEALDEDQRWLVEVAHMGRLDDETIERVRAIGQRTFTNARGDQESYLTPYEVENLCIRRGTLNEAEWENVRSHAAYSRAYLERIPWSDNLARIPRIAGDHHEKLDGSGYPKGLTAEDLSVQVRMLTIADIFDALTSSDRTYRKAAPVDRAVRILREEASQGKLDEELVHLFVEKIVPEMTLGDEESADTQS